MYTVQPVSPCEALSRRYITPLSTSHHNTYLLLARMPLTYTGGNATHTGSHRASEQQRHTDRQGRRSNRRGTLSTATNTQGETKQS